MIVRISSISDLNKISNQIEAVYFQRSPSFSLLKKIISRLQNLKKIFLNKSGFQRVSKKSQELLKSKKISLIVADMRGRAIESPSSKLSLINEYKRDALSLRKISSKTGVPKSTLHYLFRYAKKNKIKKDNIVIILKNFN